MNSTLESKDLVALSQVRTLAATGIARHIRAAADLSLAEVASVVGVAEVTISRWERGLRSPHGAAALRYAELLDQLASRGRRRS